MEINTEFNLATWLRLVSILNFEFLHCACKLSSTGLKIYTYTVLTYVCMQLTTLLRENRLM